MLRTTGGLTAEALLHHGLRQAEPVEVGMGRHRVDAGDTVVGAHASAALGGNSAVRADRDDVQLRVEQGVALDGPQPRLDVTVGVDLEGCT